MTDPSLSMSGCPNEEQLAALNRGRLPADEIESLAAHLDNCPQCQSRLQALTGGAGSLVGEIRRDLELTEIDTTAPSTLDTSAPTAPASPTDGRFTIIRLHAKGGLGQVSLARDEKLKRTVALKEIRPDKRDNSYMRRRFLAEAEITGQLEHPGIVPIYDLDQDADGDVHYAMRFVQGRTLSDAIRDYHLSATPLVFRELLQRFVSVCQTIAYAHSQGVIHRDLKPANVLLGDYGETLVVDWGLAKRLTAQGTLPASSDAPSAHIAALEQTMDTADRQGGEGPLTQAGQVLGTPAYMAPEQAAGDIARTGTPADVYSLGAILYELLTGRPPYQGKDADDVLASVRQGFAAPPSQLCRRVPRALEAVCLKAMALKPEDRYPSPRELAADVEHWLADERVSAYRDRWHERAGRWMRKHRSWAVAGAVALLLVAIVSTVAALAINQQKQQIAALAASELTARKNAEAKRQEAEDAGNRATRAHTTARQAIDELGNVAYDLRRHRPLLRRAADYYRQLIATGRADSPAQRYTLAKAQSNLGTLLVALNDFATAESAYKEGITHYEALVSTDSRPTLRSELATAHGNLGGMYHLTFRVQDAAEAFKRAIQLQQKVVADHPDDFLQRQELARFYINRGLALSTRRMDDAEKDLRQAVKLLQKLLEEQPDSARVRHYLAAGLVQLGVTLTNQADRARARGELLAAAQAAQLLATAQKNVEDGVRRLEELLRKEPAHSEYRKDLAIAFAELGRILATRGDRTQAQEKLQTAITFLTQLLHEFPSDPDFRRKLALAHFSLGIVYNMSRSFDEAQNDYRSAIEIQQQLAADFPQAMMIGVEAAKSWTNLAVAQKNAGNAAAGIKSVETAIEQMQSVWKRNAADQSLRDVLYQTYYALAQLAIETGDHERLVKGGESHAALQPNQARDQYDAARLIALAIPLVDRDKNLNADEKQKTADKYGRRAVELLKRAIELGLQGTAKLRSESDLKPLRSRDDFKKLVESVSGK